MGYYAHAKGKLIISDDVISDLSLTVRLMLNDSASMRGGSWNNGVKEESWFAWVDSKKLHDACSSKDLLSIFHSWGFGFDKIEKDTYELVFNSKLGQEDLFLTKIAPFITRGEIFWSGEDGMCWKNEFKNGVFRSFRTTK